MAQFGTTDLIDGCAAPEDVPKALRAAAEKYEQDAADLQAAWSDPNAGKVWLAFARRLRRTADGLERDIERYV